MKPLNQCRVVVTGAGGFIGSHLTEHLVSLGADVTALVRYNSRADEGFLDGRRHDRLHVVAGDIRDPFAVDRLLSECDIVFHLAALIGIPYSYTAPASYIETNVNGTLNVLEAARKYKISKVLVTSTSEVYGTALHTPMPETHPLQPQSPYAASKVAADALAQSYARSFELPVVVVRPFNTFGPRQSMRAVIPTIMVQALTGKPVKIGDTSPVRDLNFVANTTAAFVAAAESGVADGRVYNFATGRGITIGDLAKVILDLAGNTAGLETDAQRIRPERSEVRALIGDATLAQTELGWRPAITLEEGLRQTLAWVKENASVFRRVETYHT